MVKENKSFTISCKCGETITVGMVDEAVGKKWDIKRSAYSSNPSVEFKSVTEVRCPECAEKERLRKYNSSDIYERLSTDYYQDKPDEFREHAIDSVGLRTHPKADKAYALAYDHGHSGGYSEILNALQDYADLLLND
jgi:hypothetical protein